MESLRSILLPVSGLYGGAVSLRNFWYDRELLTVKKLPVPVISVGNISVGGSGKTPFVMYLIEKLLSAGRKPSVLTRGYKRISNELVISCPGHDSAQDVQSLGDEPALISQNFPDVPVAVHPDRYRSGLEVIRKYGADVFILDDGLQNRELHRDIDFILMKSTMSDLKDHYLPAGNLRDSKRRLADADVVVLTSHGDAFSSNQDFAAVRRFSSSPVAGISYVPSRLIDMTGVAYPLDNLKGKEVAAFCGVANPDRFFGNVAAFGASVVRKTKFRDHHWFDEYDIDEVFGGDEELLAVTTAKDAVRIFQDEELSQLEDVRRIYAVSEQAVVNFGESDIDAVLDRILVGAYA